MLIAHVRPDLELTLAYVAHGLRDRRDDDDEAARVADLAQRVHAAPVVLPVDIHRTGDGLEADARRARHAALEEEVRRQGARFVAYAHHAEDQAETLLLRSARGTGVDGLAGMAVMRGMRLRPLLDVRQADVHRAADTIMPGVVAGASHDRMNDDVRFARVRLRREVLPALAAVSPDPVGALLRLADLARADADVLDTAVTELAEELVVRFGVAVLVPSAALRALPLALGRRLLRVLLPEGEARTAQNVARVLSAPDGWRATLPGPIDVEVDRGHHLVVPVALPHMPARPLDDVVTHQRSGITITRTVGDDLVAHLSGGVPPGLSADRLAVALNLAGPLAVRTRSDGDRVRTPGGSRSLGDVLNACGVPRAVRDLLPVVVDEADRVVWVPGVVVDVSARRPGAPDGR